MDLRYFAARAINRALMFIGLRARRQIARDFALTESQILSVRSRDTEMHRSFFAKGKRPAHKWQQYLDVYDKHLSGLKGKPIFFLEIGVMDGGSLEMWRRYFGTEATIVGIDIDPRCADLVDTPNIIRVGSQADPVFLRKLIQEFGAPDVVLDDGSHIATHQRASLEILFPMLKPDSLYIIEDMHTSYWPDYEGGYKRGGTAVELVKSLIDELHSAYHDRQITPIYQSISGLHVYDSVTVIEKKPDKLRSGYLEGGIG